MLQITQLTLEPKQNMTVALPNGDIFTMNVRYKPQQQGWFIENLTYSDFVLNSLRITTSPNMLLQWRNFLPFGLGCFSVNNREPMLLEDFTSGDCKLYVLSQAEVQDYVDFITYGYQVY